MASSRPCRIPRPPPSLPEHNPKTCTNTNRCVTHVLTQVCYRCPDRAHHINNRISTINNRQSTGHGKSLGRPQTQVAAPCCVHAGGQGAGAGAALGFAVRGCGREIALRHGQVVVASGACERVLPYMSPGCWLVCRSVPRRRKHRRFTARWCGWKWPPCYPITKRRGTPTVSAAASSPTSTIRVHQKVSIRFSSRLPGLTAGAWRGLCGWFDQGVPQRPLLPDSEAAE